LMGVRSLTFAVGSYLSIATTLAIFAGGMVRWMVDRAAAKAGESSEVEGEISPGSLYASGLIAAGGIVGLLGVGLKLVEPFGENILQLHVGALDHDWVAVLMFALLAFSLYHFARKPLAKNRTGMAGRQKFQGVLQSDGTALGWTIVKVPFEPVDVWPKRKGLRVR